MIIIIVDLFLYSVYFYFSVIAVKIFLKVKVLGLAFIINLLDILRF